ncbi:MAG: pyruvate kinase [Deltaproteobacteria bacterium RBG_16_71_12]|nr:MAG: pyruvate kinase [Deltaproteobacteria bacterium RBG_16_71_12]
MPIINDPPKRTTRAARHAQQVEHKATGGVTTEAGKASEATKPVAGMADVGSVVSAQALSELDALWGKKQLDNVAQRIAQLVAPWQGFDFTGLDPAALDQLAGRLFVLEQRLTALINRMSMVDGPAKVTVALETQRQLAAVQTAVFREAVRLQDSSTKTPVGQWVVFKDTEKKPGFHTPEAHEAYYLEKLRKFIGEGGDPAQISVIDAKFLASLKDGQLCEYVVDGVDVARAAEVHAGKPSPGHTVLARGAEALTAGTFIVNKDARGNITQVVIGTFSGHFRSGIEAQHHLVRHLVAAGVPLERIVQREGQAGNPRTAEILARILGTEGAAAQRAEQAMITEAYRWDPFAAPPPPPEKKPGEGKKPKVEASGAQALPKHAMGDALRAMQQTVSDALADGVVLSTQVGGNGLSEVATIVNTVDEALRIAEQSGNTIVFVQTKALLRHLAALPAANIDDAGRATLEKLLVRWEARPVGLAAFDPADVLSQRPAKDRRTRVVATINPRATEAQLKRMIVAGMDVARFNTAHGTVAEQVALMKRIRAAAASLGRPVSIQIDLEGPKIRLGKFANPQNLEFNDIWLKEGAKVRLTTKDVLGSPELLPVDYPTLCADVKPGDPIFMNDGTVELTVLSVDKAKGTVEAEVALGGKVWDKKGINLPRSELSVRTITDEDLANLSALLPHVDLVASSFVRGPEDILFLRERMRQLGRVVPVIAKIERAEGLQHLEQITLVADALMVARGDLGVEIGYENVPAAERRINAMGKLHGKPTIVATEVLMSMVKDPSRPSRGDVEGLYAAVFDRGADAVMLGKETSFPEHPGEVIAAANRVIEKAESERRLDPWRNGLPEVGAHVAPTTVAALRIGVRS